MRDSKIPNCLNSGLSSTSPTDDDRVLFEEPGRITVREFLNAASKISDQLSSSITRRGNGRPVVLAFPTSPIYFAAIAGIWLWGGIPVPANFRMSQSGIERIVRDCDGAALITHSRSDADAIEDSDTYQDLNSKFRMLFEKRNVSSMVPPTLGGLERSEISLILYTSGSTGSSKGIAISSQMVDFCVSTISKYLGLAEWDNILLALPGFFDYGLYQFFMALHAKCRLTAVENSLYTDDIIRTLTSGSITILPLVPTLANSVVNAMYRLESQCLSVRLITSTGSPLGLKAIEDLRSAFPRSHVMPMYGLTECKRVSYLAPPLVNERPSSVGRPMDGISIAIVDDNGSKREFGEVGELTVRGPNVAVGYLNDNELNSRVFRRQQDGSVVLFTGDLMTQDRDGFLYHHGRLDDVVKIRDQRISLRETEDLLRAVPGVTDAMVAQGEGDELNAWVCISPAWTELDSLALRHAVRQIAPLEVMVPRSIEIVEELPRGHTGKPRRPRH